MADEEAARKALEDEWFAAAGAEWPTAAAEAVVDTRDTRKGATDYRKWEERAREGGALDTLEQKLDIFARRGEFSNVPRHGGKTQPDSWCFIEWEGHGVVQYTYASNAAHEVAKRVQAADLEPDGIEPFEAAKRFRAAQQ